MNCYLFLLLQQLIFKNHIMVALGWVFFFAIFFMAMWCLIFLFTVVVPGSIKLYMLNNFAPKFMRELAGLEDEKSK